MAGTECFMIFSIIIERKPRVNAGLRLSGPEAAPCLTTHKKMDNY